MILKLLRRVELWLWGPPTDPTWTPTRPIPKFTGYDPVLQRKGIARARYPGQIRIAIPFSREIKRDR